MTPINHVLRLLRIAYDLSRKELSEKIGVSVSYITSIEKGERTNPSLDLILKYSDCLGIGANDILYLENRFRNNDFNYQRMLIEVLKVVISNQEG